MSSWGSDKDGEYVNIKDLLQKNGQQTTYIHIPIWPLARQGKVGEVSWQFFFEVVG